MAPAARAQEIMFRITTEAVFLNKLAQIVQVGVIIPVVLVQSVTLALLSTLLLGLANKMSTVLRIAQTAVISLGHVACAQQATM